MPPEDSVTGWIDGLKAGDDQAALKIWERFSPRVAALAAERLPVWLRRIVDGEDVANSALCAAMMDLRAGRFPDLSTRDDLWALLACVTIRKAINHIKSARCQKRPPLDQVEPVDVELPASFPTPDVTAAAAEHFERLIDCLHRKDEVLETIAIMRFEGYTSVEIARRLGCSDRRIARKLDLIRMTWETEELQ